MQGTVDQTAHVPLFDYAAAAQVAAVFAVAVFVWCGADATTFTKPLQLNTVIRLFRRTGYAIMILE